MSFRRCAVLMLLFAVGCGSAMAESGLSASADLGYRVDRLDWTIAGDGNGQNPNVLSELSWSNMAIYQVRGKFDLRHNDLHLIGGAGYGWVYSGDNQDSDYTLDNRQGEFSRSNNRADGDVLDGSIGLGYRLPLRGATGRNDYWMPMAGYSLHQQNLKMVDGNQTVSTSGTPPLGPIAGLNSSYDAQWKGEWVGVSFIEENQIPNLTWSFDVIYHWVRYSAEANWNLRNDFMHPKSFEHRANGDGWTFSFNAASRLTQNIDLLLGFDYGRWQTAHGVDSVYPAAGGVAETRLNEVNWETLAINLGLMYRF